MHRARYACLTAVVVALLMTGATGTANAYWSGTGSGSAQASTGTIAPPVGVTASVTGASAIFADVAVDWTAGTGGVAVDGYYVIRHLPASANSPATDAPACSSSPTTLLTATSCTDTGAPDGDYTYVVTAVHSSWTAPSAPSAPVSVADARSLAFTAQPTTATAGVPFPSSITVALFTASGDPFASPGVPVTVAIDTNPAGGTLTGVTTVTTDTAGEATFAGLSIDLRGVGYTLTAAAPGLDPATSVAFDVLPPPILGVAGPFSVLAGTAVGSTGATTVSGDVGVSPGTAVTGFPPGIVGGDIHADDADAVQAQAALQTTYDDLSTRPPDGEITGDLGGRTLLPGVYHSTAALALTGTLTLDAQGDPDSVFIFEAGAAFNTAAASHVILANGAQAASVYWVVTGAAGTGANSFLSGNILAQGAITLGAMTQLIGRALSRAAVSLAASTIRFSAAPPPTITIDGGATVVTRDVTPTITGTSSAPAGSPVTVTIAGQTLRTTVGGGGTWSVTATALTAGVDDVTAKVRAPSGDGGNASQVLTIEVNPPPVALRTTGSYSVLGGTGVANTGVTSLSGDLGVSPSTVVTGFGSGAGTVAGAVHAGDADAATARADLMTAFNDAQSRAPHTQIAGDLGGQTFHVGVHHSTAALALTGTVTLDGQGDPTAVFIFQSDAAFNTAAGSNVVLINGAQAANVFWVVTGAAGTGANTSMAGTLLATGAITLGAGTSLDGRALSLALVTLSTNALTGVAPAPAGRSAARPANPEPRSAPGSASPSSAPSSAPGVSGSPAETSVGTATP